MSQLEAFERLDRYIPARMGQTRTPGLSLALFDREQTRHLATYGLADPEASTPLTPDTMFEIGSVSKTFSAIAALQAVEAGLLDLEAPVTDYLPWFQVRSPFPPITVHHLLSHSAGLVYSADFGPDARSIVWSLRQMDVGFPPGERFYYSEPGYQTLTLVLEAVRGRPYRDIVQAHILDPLETKSTQAIITHSLRPRLARGYRHLYDDRPAHTSHPLVPAFWLEFNSGDGAIASTAADMAKFGRMLLKQGQGPNGPIISTASYQRMAQEKVPGSEYGYGLYTFEEDGVRYAGHSGDMPGYEGYLWLDVDRGLGMAMLATQPYPRGLSWQALECLQAAHLGRPWSPPPLPEPSRVENNADYTGTYQAGNKTLTLISQGERLLLEHAGTKITLEAHGDDCFCVDHPDFDLFLLRFGRQGDGGPVVEAVHGPDWYVGEGYTGPQHFNYPKEWQAYPGHYRSFNPWETNFRVVLRQGRLWLIRSSGDEAALVPLGQAEFRLGQADWSPERLRFDWIVEEQALRATLSGCPYYRFFTP